MRRHEGCAMRDPVEETVRPQGHSRGLEQGCTQRHKGAMEQGALKHTRERWSRVRPFKHTRVRWSKGALKHPRARGDQPEGRGRSREQSRKRRSLSPRPRRRRTRRRARGGERAAILGGRVAATFRTRRWTSLRKCYTGRPAPPSQVVRPPAHSHTSHAPISYCIKPPAAPIHIYDTLPNVRPLATQPRHSEPTLSSLDTAAPILALTPSLLLTHPHLSQHALDHHRPHTPSPIKALMILTQDLYRSTTRCDTACPGSTARGDTACPTIAVTPPVHRSDIACPTIARRHTPCLKAPVLPFYRLLSNTVHTHCFYRLLSQAVCCQRPKWRGAIRIRSVSDVKPEA